mmetsp:Transcript_19189/g.35058  ORF Transcript_19189/g.35058 Transcript_19189/m.35058 type:complete len:195 (-) Transcript_19189:2117-2701(-)
MTTAHRPTWHPVRGGSEQGGNRIVVPSRQYSAKDMPSQTSLKLRPPTIAPSDFRKALLEREASNLSQPLMPVTDDPTPYEEDRDEYFSDSSDEDSDDDEAELLRELERIKKEREVEEARRREEEERKAAMIRREEILAGNPLLDTAPGYSLRKKWTEDTVFRNQSRGEPKAKVRFINDTVRSDFHRKFLSRYVH